eukprot:SAG31_NODE_21642_length_544_cov_1.379775_1_plen_111_part_10
MIQTAVGAWGFSRRAKYAVGTLRVYPSDKIKQRALEEARQKYKKLFADAGGEEGHGVESLRQLAVDAADIEQHSIEQALDAKGRLIELIVEKMLDGKVRAHSMRVTLFSCF